MSTEAGKVKLFNDLYEIKGVIGRGESSVVYKAIDVYNNNAEVALKVLNVNEADPDFLKLKHRLRNEALCMISTNNKFVVKLIDFQAVGSLCYLVTEFAPYLDLKFYVETLGRPLKPSEVKLFLKQILIGLEHVHSLGVIHRDIRPENILVFSPNLVKLGDFSNAITQGEALPQEELLKAQGSLLYMPPEVITGGQPSPKGDLYSLGITFLELMRGSNPFEKIPLIQSLAARESLALDPLEDIPFDLRYTLRLLIQFDLLFRPKTAKEALSYLENPELAENKWRNLDELLKKSTPQDMHYEKQYDQKTIVLSEEEIIERIKQADSNSPRKSLLDIFKNAKNWFSKIAFVANLRRVSETRILLVLLAVSVIATASFLWLSGKEKVEANQIEIAKQWLPISMLEIPDGIYKATFSRALPVFDSIEAVIVKSDGRMHVSFLLDVAITSSAPMGEGSVILDAMTQQLRLFNPRSNKNHFILETVNLDNNLTGLLKLELLKPL